MGFRCPPVLEARSTLLVIALCGAVVNSSANICGTNATLGMSVMAALNLTYPGLEAVAAANKAGDLNTACEALATYYQTSNTSAWLRRPRVTPGSGMAGGLADDIVLRDYFYLAGVDLGAVIPRNADGGLDWLDKGPRIDVEFMNCLNRHDSFTELLGAWLSTGNPIYTSYFNAEVIDWVTHLPCPNALSGGSPCVPAGLPGSTCMWSGESTPGAQACKTGTMESPWRSLEMGIRLDGAWPQAFFGFQQAAEFSTSARVLFVLAVAEHNAALAVDGGHPGSGTPNWEMTQWQGLVSSVATFPELNNVSGLLELALTELSALLSAQVYPDGVETEMASGYDMVTAGDFFGTLSVLAEAGHAAPPGSFHDHVQAMWNYGAFVSDPRGCLPRNGDSDLCGGGYNTEIAEYFHRPDWTYVHTNGQAGTVPAGAALYGPSNLFPWAGQVVLRSGYDAQATWVWFDVGPYGSSGHAHRDKLNLVLHSRSSMLLIDSGRFAYQGTDLSAILHRAYAGNASAHNTLTISGCDQLPLPALASAPIPNASVVFTPTVDTAHGSMSLYDGLQGKGTHSRGVYYSRPAGWLERTEGRNRARQGKSADASDDGDWLVVVDAVTRDRASGFQGTWHAHPNSTVSIDPTSLVAVVGGVDRLTGEPTTAQACVIPAPAAPGVSSAWDNATLVKGVVADPATGVPWQGWYSQEYDDAWPAPTLVYEAHIDGPGTVYFAWLIIPSSLRVPCGATISVQQVVSTPAGVIVTVQVTLQGQTPQAVNVPMGGMDKA